MVKKRVLFVIPNLCSGGAQNSLVSLLNEINYNWVDVDLMLFVKEGLFLDRIPRQVSLLETNAAFLPAKKSIMAFIETKKYYCALLRLIYSCVNKLEPADSKGLISWKILKKIMPGCSKQYDTVIAYGDGESVYYAFDIVKAKSRVLWNHIDYVKMKLPRKMDRRYYCAAEKVVTISESCKQQLIESFPNIGSEIMIVENIVAENYIKAKSKESVCFGDEEGHKGIRILTIGRLTYQKGIDLAIQAMKILCNKGFDIKWYVIGCGDEEQALRELIQQNDLADRFILLGEKKNPYSYIDNVDIYVQTSRFEGKPIAIEEVKTIGKPIAITNYPTVRDSIHHGNGLIVDMEPESIAEGVIRLIQDKALAEKMLICQRETQAENRERVMNDLYRIIGINEGIQQSE